MKARVMEQKMADLPADRLVPDEPPLSYVGIDYFGPFHVLEAKAISDTVEHLVSRPLPARPRNSIWRQAKEWSSNGVYILYFLLLFFYLFILFDW
jgi:hypothetical protein